MTRDQRITMLLARVHEYGNTMRTTMFVLLGVAAILAFMPDVFSLPLLMIVIAITAYGVLAGGTALDDVIAMRDDMDEEMAATTYGTQVKARNLPGLKTLSGVLIGLIGLAEVLAIVF